MRRRCLLAVAALLLVGLTPWPAAAQTISQSAINVSATNVTLTTTSETAIIASGPATVPRETVNVCVIAWAQLTTGTSTSTVTPRIRRGTTTGGTLINEANAVTIGAAAGSTEQFVAMACEDRAGVATVEYVLTLTQAAADGNGTALQAGIFVFVR